MQLSAPLSMALATILLPLLGALLIGLLPALRKSGKPAAYLAVAAALGSLLAAIKLLSDQLAEPGRVVLEVTRWIPVEGATAAEIGIRLDGVSALMLVVVTGVAFLVQLFSLEYMAAEPPPALGRYFGYHSLFIVAMNILVLAPNLLQL
ncbi:MAG TPA: hypothetical protein PKD61_25045, partial [Polyangiaceae bacterium]|nr:hypothetical protein [Polyangiaceae bacterium]